MTDQQQQARQNWLSGWAMAVLYPLSSVAAAAHGSTPMLAAYGLIGAANYGAVILSFVGAIHWGLAMQDEPPCLLVFLVGHASAAGMGGDQPA